MDMTWDTVYFSVFLWKLDLRVGKNPGRYFDLCVYSYFFCQYGRWHQCSVKIYIYSEQVLPQKGWKKKKQASCILTPCFPSTMVTMSPHTMGDLTDLLLPTIMGDTCPPPGTTTQWLDHLSPTPRTWDPEWTPPAMYLPVSLVTSSSNGEC